MFAKVFLWAVIANALVNVVSAYPTFETNAQRLARGLPPNPPAMFAKRGSATAVYGARPSPSPSPRPHPCYSGKIEVKAESDGHVQGFVRNWEHGGISGLNFSGDPLQVKVCEAGYGLYNIIATNAIFPAPYYVGGDSGTTAGTLTKGTRSSVGFGNTPQTYPGAPPKLINGSYYESAIWRYNSSTKELFPQWINPDGSKPNTVIAYDIRVNELSFVVEPISQWNESGSPLSAVKFYLA